METHVKLCAGRLPNFVCAFQYQTDAERFYSELGKRLEKFGLVVSVEKTRVIPFHRCPPSGKSRFQFLGFEFYWGKDRGGKPHLKRRTSRNKLRNSIKRFTAWCIKNRNLKPKVLFRRLNVKLGGYYNLDTGKFDVFRKNGTRILQMNMDFKIFEPNP